MQVDYADVDEETKVSKLFLKKREGSCHGSMTIEDEGHVINKDGETNDNDASFCCTGFLG